MWFAWAVSITLVSATRKETTKIMSALRWNKTSAWLLGIKSVNYFFGIMVKPNDLNSMRIPGSQYEPCRRRVFSSILIGSFLTWKLCNCEKEIERKLKISIFKQGGSLMARTPYRLLQPIYCLGKISPNAKDMRIQCTANKIASVGHQKNRK